MKRNIDFTNLFMRQSKLKSYLKSGSQSRTPGFAAVVLKNNQVVWQKCGGLADVDRRVPITPETNFRLASLSKQFTAMSVMILVKRKKLNLESKLTDFFPDYPTYGNKVTVRQLLTHTAGIPDHEKPLYKLIKQDKNIWGCDRSVKYSEPTIYDALGVLKSQPTPLFPSGSKYQYSDAGYVVLALIIEKVSGFTYREFLKRNIFTPLKMIYSDVFDETKPKIENRAFGYKRKRLPRLPNNASRPAKRDPAPQDNDGESFEVFDYDPLNYIIGDEGVYSSINDMAKWATAWNEEILVSQKTLNEAFKPQGLSSGKLGQAGFSWLIRNYHGRKIIYQDGSWVGFRNIILKIPEQKLTVVILSNRTDLDRQRQRVSLAYKLAQKFL